MMVDKVISLLVLPPSSQGDCDMDNLSSDGSESLSEPDDDRLLSHYQKSSKLEALARRSPLKEDTKAKKGKNTSSS